MKKILVTLGIALLMVVGCEEKEDDKINQAQKCLNDAVVPADAAGCKAIIDGINTEKAHRVRCALVILENGITQQRIVDAFKAMDDSPSQDPVIEISTALGLGDLSDPADSVVDTYETGIAQTIKNTCYQSESKGLRSVAQIILFGTRAQAATGGDYTNPDDIAADIGSMPPAEAGEFANDVFDLYCVPTYSNDDICKTLAAAGAGTASNAVVGGNLQACLAANNCN